MQIRLDLDQSATKRIQYLLAKSTLPLVNPRKDDWRRLKLARYQTLENSCAAMAAPTLLAVVNL